MTPRAEGITYDQTVDPLPIGSTGEYDLAFLRDGVAVDLNAGTGSTIFFTAKKKVTDSDADAVFKYDSTNNPTNLIKTAGAGGTAKLFISASDTENATVGTLVCDLKVKDETGKFFTYLFFLLPICGRVTQRTS